MFREHKTNGSRRGIAREAIVKLILRQWNQSYLLRQDNEKVAMVHIRQDWVSRPTVPRLVHPVFLAGSCISHSAFIPVLSGPMALGLFRLGHSRARLGMEEQISKRTLKRPRFQAWEQSLSPPPRQGRRVQRAMQVRTLPRERVEVRPTSWIAYRGGIIGDRGC